MNLHIITKYLFNILHIRFTNRYLQNKITESSTNSMAAFSSFLDHYRIANVAVRLHPHQLAQATFPCVAHCQDADGLAYFVVVESFSNGEVIYHDGTQSHRLAVEVFTKLWSGSVLLLAPNAQSGEPNYEANKKKEQQTQIFRWLGFGLLLVAVVLSATQIPFLFWAIKILYVLGAGASVLLLLNETGQHNSLTQKLCGWVSATNNKASGCDAISQSAASKLFGTLGWSEIGLVYFVGGFLSLAQNGQNNDLVALLAVLFVPYSLYYQGFVAKQWCALCLVVQAVLVAVVGVYWAAGSYEQVVFSISTLLSMFWCYAFVGGSWLLLREHCLKVQQLSQLENTVAHWQQNSAIFKAFLAAQPHIDLSPLPHEDQIGNVDAPVVVTMVSNPQCSPCQEAHQELSDCVAFFEDELQLRVRHINTGEAKYESHEAFAKAVGVQYTPTIFINGHQLQQPYSFRDIRQQVRALAE
jgi:glutaredoxin/uncharacterized membrane protein